MDDISAYLTVDQAAAVLGYTSGYVRKLVQRNLLMPAVHLPHRALLFAPVEIARYSATHREPGRPRKSEGTSDAGNDAP